MPGSDGPADSATAAGGSVADAQLPSTYEQAREELLEVVHRLESGGASLEESLALWERGEALARLCQQWLDGARARLDAAVAAERGPDGGTG